MLLYCYNAIMLCRHNELLSRFRTEQVANRGHFNTYRWTKYIRDVWCVDLGLAWIPDPLKWISALCGSRIHLRGSRPMPRYLGSLILYYHTFVNTMRQLTKYGHSTK